LTSFHSTRHPKEGIKLIDLPSLVSQRIAPETDENALEVSWNYLLMVGKLNFLEKSMESGQHYHLKFTATFSRTTKIFLEFQKCQQ
jgi:hypothetical protein